MSNLDSHETPLPSQTPVAKPEPEAPSLPVPPALATNGPLSTESIQAGGPLSTAGSPATGSNVTDDAFSRMLSKEIEKVRQLVADAGDVAATVPEFDEFEKWARKWENGSRSRRSVVEALLEEALDKVAVVHARLFASGAVRANPIFDQLLSKEQRRARDRVIARVAKEARHGSGEPFKLPADFTLDKLLALPVHPAAQAFPMLEDSALKLLTEDIRRSRCRLPVDDRGDPEKSDRHELRQS